MAATLDRPCPGSVERARRTRATQVGRAGERAGVAVAGREPGEAGLEQGAERGDVAVDGAGGRRHGPQADQAVGAQHDVLGGQAADGQADPVGLGDALGEPAEHGADLAVGHRAAGEPLGERLAVDPLVDDVGGAAGGLRVTGALGGVVDHRQRGGGQAAGGQRPADPGVGRGAGGGVHADGDVPVEDAVLRPPAADDAGRASARPGPPGRWAGSGRGGRWSSMSSTLSTPCPEPTAGASAPAAAAPPARNRSSASRPGPDGSQGLPDLRNAGDHETCESHAADDHGTDQHLSERACGRRAEQVVGHSEHEPARLPPATADTTAIARDRRERLPGAQRRRAGGAARGRR